MTTFDLMAQDSTVQYSTACLWKLQSALKQGKYTFAVIFFSSLYNLASRSCRRACAAVCDVSHPCFAPVSLQA